MMFLWEVPKIERAMAVSPFAPGCPQTSCSPQNLVASLNLQRLYMPDRVRRRDLAAAGDAFRVFKELKVRG